MTTPQIESRFIGPGGVCKASTTAKAASATHTAHSDHASQAAVRRLIPPTPRPCSLAPCVTTPLYRAAVSQTLRQALRSRAGSQLPRIHLLGAWVNKAGSGFFSQAVSLGPMYQSRSRLSEHLRSNLCEDAVGLSSCQTSENSPSTERKLSRLLEVL